jgi:hypothetical protein
MYKTPVGPGFYPRQMKDRKVRLEALFSDAVPRQCRRKGYNREFNEPDITKYIVACKAVTMQRPRVKRLYQSRF